MEDTAHSDVVLPPPEPPPGPVRKWGWFLIVLAFVLALIGVMSWYCVTVVDVPPPPCHPQAPALGTEPVEITGTDCPQGVTHAYRCEPYLQKAKDFFTRGRK